MCSSEWKEQYDIKKAQKVQHDCYFMNKNSDQIM